ncbi:MAG: hypothetical protein JWQ35_347 [Bacteriovoracaceae bacterium]|nr:hypothetical protein [Bacteriovoracaceae bacterium]
MLLWRSTIDHRPTRFLRRKNLPGARLELACLAAPAPQTGASAISPPGRCLIQTIYGGTWQCSNHSFVIWRNGKRTNGATCFFARRWLDHFA